MPNRNVMARTGWRRSGKPKRHGIAAVKQQIADLSSILQTLRASYRNAQYQKSYGLTVSVNCGRAFISGCDYTAYTVDQIAVIPEREMYSVLPRLLDELQTLKSERAGRRAA
jgi:hypothetical protein